MGLLDQLNEFSLPFQYFPTFLKHTVLIQLTILLTFVLFKTAVGPLALFLLAVKME